MSFEIEQKFRTDGHEAIAARLGELGAIAGSQISQEDDYLSHPCRDFAATNEAFRIRRVGTRNAVTYKGPKRGGPTKTREEIEVAFGEGANALSKTGRLFESLGFRSIALIRKLRTPYRLHFQGHAVEIVLDVAEGLGTFVEVEAIAEGEAGIAEAQRVVMELAAALGLKELELRSYLGMALELRAGAKSD